MAGDSIDFGNTVHAQLHPTRRALRTHPAPPVVMLHRSHPDPRLLFGNARSNGHDLTTRFMARNDGTAPDGEAEGRGAPSSTVELEVTAAHPRSLNLQHDFAGPGLRVRELEDLELAISNKD